jgi:nicotinate-nucleotide adenylyltransferase
VHRGMPVWYLVPDGVVQYIEKRGLYRGTPRRPPPDGARAGRTGAQPGTTTTDLQEVPR